MKVIDYVLILIVVFLLGYGVYQKRSVNKEHNKQLKNLAVQLQNVQDQLDDLKSNPVKDNEGASEVIKELKETSSNLNNQIEILSEDLASKLEKSEEKINFLMEQEKKKKNQGCCNSAVKIKKEIIYKEKKVSCDQSEKYYKCIVSKQANNIKACQEAKLIKSNPLTKTTEITKTNRLSKLETINESVTLTRVTSPKNNLVVDDSCFEKYEDTQKSCLELVCR